MVKFKGWYNVSINNTSWETIIPRWLQALTVVDIHVRIAHKIKHRS